MLQLPNNCRAGKFSIFPSNWKNPRADKSLIWRITYWFFDDNLGQKKQVVIKGMNRLEELRDKQRLMKEFIEDEEALLMSGVNRITKTKSVDLSEISGFTPLLSALEYSLKNHPGERDTKIDITSSLKFFSIAARALGFDRLPVGEIRKKHIKIILDEMGSIETYTTREGVIKPKLWNDRLFNHTRANISSLFSPLEEIEAIEFNPVKGVKKRRKIKKIREIPSGNDRQLLQQLKETHYPFFRFIQIFFHSGVRAQEILRVRKKDVLIDLSDPSPAKHIQQFKIVLKKGGKFEEVIKPIKDIAVPYWLESLALAKDNDILFSAGLLPGEKIIRREQITRRWRLHVKKKLGVSADFYALKHLNVTEMMDITGDEKQVAKLTGHVVTKEKNTLAEVYDINSRRRKDDIVKRANNPL